MPIENILGDPDLEAKVSAEFSLSDWTAIYGAVGVAKKICSEVVAFRPAAAKEIIDLDRNPKRNLEFCNPKHSGEKIMTDNTERAREARPRTKSETEIRAYVEANSDRYDHDREPPLEFSYLRMALLLLDDERKVRAADTQARGGWRPIESAPKDGVGLIHGPGYGTIIGYWHNGTCEHAASPYHWAKITHWQPLPPPPLPEPAPQEDQK